MKERSASTSVNKTSKKNTFKLYFCDYSHLRVMSVKKEVKECDE